MNRSSGEKSKLARQLSKGGSEECQSHYRSSDSLNEQESDSAIAERAEMKRSDIGMSEVLLEPSRDVESGRVELQKSMSSAQVEDSIEMATSSSETESDVDTSTWGVGPSPTDLRKQSRAQILMNAGMSTIIRST